MRRLILVCIALLPVGNGAPAQLILGARVRIAVSGQRPYAGTLLAVGADTLVLQSEPGTDTLRIPKASVSRVDVSRSPKSHLGADIGYGAIVGAAAGALFGAVECSSHCGEPDDQGLAPVVISAFAVIGAGAGAIVGGVIGAGSRRERWEQVPSDRWSLSVAP